MALAYEFLAPALKQSGLSRRQLAKRTGSSEAGLAEVFHGQKDTTVGRLTTLLAALGQRIVTIPRHAAPLQGYVEDVTMFLDKGQPENAYRVVLQLAEDLRSLDSATQVVCTYARPTTTGELKFDSLIAGIAEIELSAKGSPLPQWLQVREVLDEPWDVEPVPELRAAARAITPEPLAARGVYADPIDFVNV